MLQAATKFFTRHSRTAGTVLIVSAGVAVIGEAGATFALLETGAMAAVREGVNEALAVTVGALAVGAALVAPSEVAIHRTNEAGLGV